MYGQYFAAFAKAGYNVFAYDRKGFGKSEGSRGKVGDHLVEECLDFIYLVVRERQLENVKKFVYGVSKGGLLAARIAVETKDFFDGIILTVPWFDGHRSLKINKAVKFAVRVASKIKPGFSLTLRKGMLPPEREEFLEYLFKTYPYFGPPMQLLTLKKSFDLQNYVSKNSHEITCPVFMCLSSEDPTVCNIAAEKLFNSLENSKDKKLKIYENHTHAVHMQDGMQQVLQIDVLDWLNERTSSCSQ